MRPKLLPLLVVVLFALSCNGIGIEFGLFQPAEATATALALRAALTMTSDAATAKVERAIRATLTAVVPTRPPPVTPTTPPVSTATMTPRPATAVPTLPPPTQKPSVKISVACGKTGASPRYVEADQPVILIWGWIATTEAYRQDYIDAASFSLQIEGQVVDGASATLTLSGDSNGYTARWSLPPRIFASGTHQIIPTITLARQITDGYDANNDGSLDTFGPGVETYPPCEIIVP